MSERNEKKANSSVVNTVLKKVESLLDISSSSLDANSLSVTHHVDHTVNSILDVALPKLRSKLMGHDVVHKEVQKIKESLDGYSQQMQSVDQDVAEIFLDLHNIYKRLEKLDGSGRKLSSAKKSKLLKHVKESEDLLSRSRHFLTNDPKELSAMLNGPPKEPPSNSKVRGRLSPSSNPNNDRYQGGLNQIGSPLERKYRHLHTKRTEKPVFLSNMVMIKKSDFSLHLNRYKTYFCEAKRALSPDFYLKN